MQNREESEHQRVSRAAGGDAGAFHELVDAHAPMLFRTAYAMLGNTADAEDVVQEAFLAAYRGIGRFQGRSSLRTWLVSILTRQVLMLRRKRRGKAMAGLDAAVGAAARPAGDPVDARLDVAQALARLSEGHREVLVLRELEGMSYDEIAAALEIPRGTVESRLFRARQELKGQMPEYGRQR